MIECRIFYKHISISCGETISPRDLIEFNLLDVDIILGMEWLHAYGAKNNYNDLVVILCDEKRQEVYFDGLRKEKPCPLISLMSSSKLL